MSVTAKCFINSQYAAASWVTEYTVPADKRVIIDKFSLNNTHSSAVDVSIRIVPSGEAPGDSHLVVKELEVAIGGFEDVEILKNQILEEGDIVQVMAATADKVVQRMSGREVA